MQRIVFSAISPQTVAATSVAREGFRSRTASADCAGSRTTTAILAAVCQKVTQTTRNIKDRLAYNKSLPSEGTRSDVSGRNRIWFDPFTSRSTRPSRDYQHQRRSRSPHTLQQHVVSTQPDYYKKIDPRLVGIRPVPEAPRQAELRRRSRLPRASTGAPSFAAGFDTERGRLLPAARRSSPPAQVRRGGQTQQRAVPLGAPSRRRG